MVRGSLVDWLQQTSVPSLGASDIHVWRAGLDRDGPMADRFHTVLSLDERQRAERFHFERDRRRFVAARGTLRLLLGGYLGIAPQALRFVYGKFGKPALALSDRANLQFNLSHSGELAVFAMAWRCELGIDVEKHRADYGGEAVARRFFAQGEVQQWLALPPKARSRGFFDIWTRKEATIKARGAGIGTLERGDFEVNGVPGEPARFVRGAAGWHIRDIQVDADFSGALVYRGVLAHLRFFSFG